MEDSPAGLNCSGRRAFTLVELLIALALTAVVMGLAWIVMDSTRKVSLEIEQPVDRPVDAFWQQLQWEFDRLLPSPVNTKRPPLRFSPENGLEMVALLPDADGIPLQTELHYFLKEKELFKIRQSGFPPTAQTNPVFTAVQHFAVLVQSEGQDVTEWPPEKNSPLPARLQMEMEGVNGQRSQHDFYLPAAFRVKKTTADEAASDN